MQRGMTRLCVFCGSNAGSQRYVAATRGLARLLAERRIGIVYGGGNVGLMGELADAALDAGGEVIGVIPTFLVEREVAHQGLSELREVRSMHERKSLMHELADGFVALPGGLGTFEELLETLTWAQLGLHGKPVGVLDVDGFYGPLVALFDRATRDGFVRAEHRALLFVESDPGRLLEVLAAWRPPTTAKWLGREET